MSFLMGVALIAASGVEAVAFNLIIEQWRKREW